MLDGARPVLEVSDLKTVFDTRDGEVHAVNGVSFTLAPGELLGVVGESGSGKSVTMMSLMRLLPSPPARIAGGDIRFEGRDVRAMSERELRALRGGDIGFVFQDPMTSLTRCSPRAISSSSRCASTSVCRRRRRGRRSFWGSSASRTPRRGSTPSRTSSRAACASG